MQNNSAQDKDKLIAKMSIDEQYAVFSKRRLKFALIECFIAPVCIAAALCSIYLVPDKYFLPAIIGVFILMIAVCYIASDLIKLNRKITHLKTQGAGQNKKSGIKDYDDSEMVIDSEPDENDE